MESLKEKKIRFEFLSKKRMTTDKEDEEFDRLADDVELAKYMGLYNK